MEFRIHFLHVALISVRDGGVGFLSFCVDCFLNASLYTYTTYPLDGLIFEICAVQLTLLIIFSIIWHFIILTWAKLLF
jgi:hypothetical protein